jgi:glycosyltransferase involved in cell wall biosynthesis
MTTLRVVVDQLVTENPDGISRYTEELTRQLIATAPAGCEVEGLVSSVPPETLEDLAERLPGISRVTKLPLPRRELMLAWQRGLVLPPGHGMTHATSLFAPLANHDRITDGDQITVTMHDVLAWTHPEALAGSTVRWHKAMAKRARRYADAVVVPTHAVAEQLAEILDFGDRIRVIGGAAASTLRLPADADDRARRLGLPDRFILGMGSIDPREGVRELIQAMALPEAQGLPFFIAGPDRIGEESASGVAAAAGLPEGRLTILGFLGDADLAVAMHRATAFVFPSVAEGFGLPLVEAFQLGTPVIHSDDPAVLEVSGGAGLAVSASEPGYPQRLASAIGQVLTDPALASKLRVQSTDRAKAFSWRDSAERVWQLHADL